MAAIIEPASFLFGKLDDLTPFQAGPLDIVRIEQGGGGAVEVSGQGAGLDAAVEDQWAFDCCFLFVRMGHGEHGGGCCGQEAEDCGGVHLYEWIAGGDPEP